MLKKLALGAAFSVFSLGAFAQFKYIEIVSFSSANTLQLQTPQDFEALAKTEHVDTACYHKESDLLLFFTPKVCYTLKMNGYRTISDYKTGIAQGYDNGYDFQDAKELSLDASSSLYYFYRRNAFNTVEDCKDAFKNGFCTLEHTPKEREEEVAAPELPDSARKSKVKSVTEIKDKFSSPQSQTKPEESLRYYRAKDADCKTLDEYTVYLDFTVKGFKSWKDMEEARRQNFPVPQEILAEKGVLIDSKLTDWMKNYPVGKDFYQAKENGFTDYKDYAEAKERGLVTFSDWQKYRSIRTFCDNLVKKQSISKGFALISWHLSELKKSELSLSVLSKTLEENHASFSKELQDALLLYINNVVTRAEYESQRKVHRVQTFQIPQMFGTQSLKSYFETVNISAFGSYTPEAEIFKRF